MSKLVWALILGLFIFKADASGWREGKVINLASGYDGQSITFRLSELTPESPPIDYTKCTCNASWQHLCLDPSRVMFKQEFSMLLAAQSQQTRVSLIFDDNVCFVKALVLDD